MTPKIIGLEKIKYPPGTVLRAKHRHDLIYVVHSVSSWHDYNSVVWTEEGLEIRGVTHYTLYRNGKISISCEEYHINEGYDVMPRCTECDRQLKTFGSRVSGVCNVCVEYGPEE